MIAKVDVRSSLKQNFHHSFVTVLYSLSQAITVIYANSVDCQPNAKVKLH